MRNEQINPQRMRLGAGESRWLRAEAGMMFVGVEGRFSMIETPRWLADTAWHTGMVVDAGQQHAVNAAGWVQITSQAGAELIYLPADATAEPHHWLADAWRLLARRAFA